jgi:hypothetical protein
MVVAVERIVDADGVEREPHGQESEGHPARFPATIAVDEHPHPLPVRPHDDRDACEDDYQDRGADDEFEREARDQGAHHRAEHCMPPRRARGRTSYLRFRLALCIERRQCFQGFHHEPLSLSNSESD